MKKSVRGIVMFLVCLWMMAGSALAADYNIYTIDTDKVVHVERIWYSSISVNCKPYDNYICTFKVTNIQRVDEDDSVYNDTEVYLRENGDGFSFKDLYSTNLKPDTRSLSYTFMSYGANEYTLHLSKSVQSADVIVQLQKKTPTTDVAVDKKVSVVAGFKQDITMIPKDTHRNYVGKFRWKSSNNKVATVDQNGCVTGKKKGNCKITATAGNRKYTVKVTVKDNRYTDNKKYSVSSFSYSHPGVIVKSARYQGKNLVLKCTIYNNRMFAIEKFDFLKLMFKTNVDQKIFASKKFKNLRIRIPAYGKRNVTLKIPVKKKINLRQEKWSYEDDYVYTYVY